MQPVPRRLTVACAIALLVLFAAAGSAAAFSVTSVTATPRAPVSGEPGFGLDRVLTPIPSASGAHPVMDIVTTFDVSDGVGGATTARDLVQHLGAGIVANPHATAACTQADFNAASPAPAGCAANTQVGTATATVLGGPATTRTLPGVIYNLEPNAGQPAALGIAFDLTLLGRAGLFLKDFAPVTVDPTDLGLNTTLTNLNPALPIVATRLTLWGYAATGGNPPLVPYFTNPAACSPASVSVSATAYDGDAEVPFSCV